MQRKTYRDFKVSVLSNLLIVVLFPQRLFGAHCPSSCWCVDNSVNCNEKTFTEIPNDVPKDTVYLNMDNNQLRVLDLQLLSKLPNLQFLTIRDNQIAKVKPAKFKLTNLKTLDLHGNCFRVIENSPFSVIPNLMNLDLSKNSLTSVEGVFKNLRHLSHLTLSDNDLTDIFDDVFLDTVRLEKLDLKDNKMEKLDFNVFGNLRQLSLLDLTRNPISEITGSSENNSNLNVLDLSQCRLAEIPSNLPSSLVYLNVGSNRLTFIGNASLQNYGRLENLILDHNKISTIERRSFLHLKRLTHLDLSDNSLSNFPGFFPKTLQYVYMDRNNISSLSFTSFSRIPYLTSLSLINNKLTTLNRKSFRILRSLKFLYLDGNPLKALAEHDLSEQRELEVLSLNSCPLDKLAFRPFIKLKKLRELHLAFIQHRLYFNTAVLKELPNLEKLNLQGSPDLIYQMIKRPENLVYLKENIKVLNIMNGYLTYVPSKFKDYLRNALKIKLAGNPLHCDANLEWLRDWIKEEPDKFPQKDLITCRTPKSIQGTSIYSLTDDYFQSITASSNQPAPPVFTPDFNVQNQVFASQEEIIPDVDYADDLTNYPVSGPEKDTNCLTANIEEDQMDINTKTGISMYASTVNAIETDISSFPPREEPTAARSSTPCADCNAPINTENNQPTELPQKSPTVRINNTKRDEIQDGNYSRESDKVIVSVTVYENRPSDQPTSNDISSTKAWLDKSNLPRSDTSKELISNTGTATPFKHISHSNNAQQILKENRFDKTDFPTTVTEGSTLGRGVLLNDMDIEVINESNVNDTNEKSTDNPNRKGDREVPLFLQVAAITASSWAGVLAVSTGSFLFILRRFRQKEKKERRTMPNDATGNC